MSGQITPAVPGPSPRGRGNPYAPMRAASALGAIPAWAGEPAVGRSDIARPRGHPRVGGGTSPSPAWLWAAAGPSPRGRGNHLRLRRPPAALGAIPAWAGEPRSRSCRPTHGRGHPRVGGGTTIGQSLPSVPAGPSPRGRGNRRRQPGAHARDGAIPAWAGEPASCRPFLGRTGGHPRVGGGTCTVRACAKAAAGPSPRGRGNQIGGLVRDARRVGHPRVGGGTPELMAWLQAEPGPSPRGRGNREHRDAVGPRRGAIPAWAGEPKSRACRRCDGWGHPRVGGGTLYLEGGGGITVGPSPRGRGNLEQRARHRVGKGAIPAWAGEPSMDHKNMCGERGHPRVGGGTPSAPRPATG